MTVRCSFLLVVFIVYSVITVFICHDFIVKQIPLKLSALQFINLRLDELSEMLKVKELSQKVFHVGPR